MTFDQALHLGIEHHRGGRLEEAERLYRQVLSQQPNHPDALQLLGIIADRCNQPAAAAALIARAIAIDPNVPDYHNNLGNALVKSAGPMSAIPSFQNAIRLRPDFAEAYNNLGAVLRMVGEFDQAIVCFQSALKLNPNHAETHNNLGNALRDAGRIDEAIAAYQTALRLQPNRAGVHNNLGNALAGIGRQREATAAYRAAMQYEPHNPLPHSNLLYTMHYDPDSDPASLYEAHSAWNRQHALPLKASWPAHSNVRNPDRRLKVGYVSADFRGHVVGGNLLPLLEHHDHERFEIVCYSDVAHPDETTETCRKCADVWRSILGMDDARVAELVRADGIDILIDLALHSSGNRLMIFARKPAPVQVSYLGYCSTTGMDAIDYRLSDPHLDPENSDLNCYSEKTIRLPATYWCYAPSGPTPEVGPLPALQNDFVTFGCLNNFAKVSDQAISLWTKILGSVERSRLIIHAPDGAHRGRVLQQMNERGVASERIEFVPRLGWKGYIATFGRIDISLDPFPYGGGITSCDSLFMGVPVVSLSGKIPVSRGGRSILANVGLTHLIAHSFDDYIAVTTGLCSDFAQLSKLRGELRQRMKNSPLMNAPQFARDVETAYRHMWRQW